MHLVCPECKNDVDLEAHPKVKVGQVVECDKCGITLSVLGIDGDEINAEVVDEGK
ncbi:MAG: lysine biosynthesis protein LysW [Candidatus Magasanikbacteria bacterium]|nr:lysine biosynthesis protein LysW [Candidatus Magasanikbacteria bacterium]